ncbi:MAG: D-mannonate epimerase, partial [Acidobacteriaceae bacterium]|nr:D-mannonate epimerase [Acidobacteriaceae bacterium]
MSIFFAAGSPTTEITREQLRASLFHTLERLDASAKKKRVLALPPDITRLHSQAGALTQFAWEYYGDRLACILPALGTHRPMTAGEIATMFGPTPLPLFRVHDWRNDVVTLGEVPGEFLHEVSEGKVDYPWPAQVNKLL